MTNIKKEKRIIGMKGANMAGDTAIYIVLSLLAFIWVAPIIYIVLTSFRAEGTVYVSYIIPKEFTLDNYIKLFTDTTQFNFTRWLTNTLIVAVATCLISTLLVLMVSYTLSRLRFKLRRSLMNFILVLGMFPGFMSMIAIYNILKLFSLTQTLLALVLVYSSGAGMGYYIMKGFFDTIPKELDEAARIDGATRNRIFWQMTIPLSKPIIIYTMLTSFMGPWLDFIFVSVIMKDSYNNYTVALGLWKMIERENIDTWYKSFAAGSVIVGLITTVLFIFMQKYYVGGVTSGAVKG